MRTEVLIILMASWPGVIAAQVGPMPTVVDISAADSGDDIVVNGVRADAKSLGALGDRPVLDTPFSISTYDSALIKDAQLVSMSDLLKLEPGATVALTSFGEGASFALRGFDLYGDFYTDGLLGLGGDRSDPPLELYEGVQILKGAAGFLYGFTRPGGIVNFITKRFKAEPFLTLDAGYAEKDLFRGALDAGTATADGRYGVRLNVAGERGTSAYTDTGLRRLAFGLNADAQVTSTTRLQLDLLRSRRRMIGDTYGINVPDDLPIPDPISGRTRLGADNTGFRYQIDSAALRVVQDLGGDWRATLAGAVTRTRFNYYDTILFLRNAAGDVDFGNYTTNFRDVTETAQLLVTGKAAIGPVIHDIAFGAYYNHLSEDRGLTSAGESFTGVVSSAGNIYTGLRRTADLAEIPSLQRGYRAFASEERALFASDTIGVGPHWQLLAGLRYAWRRERSYNADGTSAGGQTVRKLTPNVALIYKPVPHVTAYLSYAQSLQPGAVAPDGTQNAGQRFPAIASKQYEAGLKASIRGLLATAALFRIEQGFSYQRNVAGQLPVFTQDGIERHDGFEAQLSGNLGPEWRVSGGIQLLDASVRDSTPDLVGKEPPAVPETQAKLFAEYAPAALPGAAVNAIGIYTSGSEYDPLNERRYDGFVTLDFGVRYRLARGAGPVTLRANVDNLFGRRYWLPRSGGLIPGAPRTLRMSATMDF